MSSPAYISAGPIAIITRVNAQDVAEAEAVIEKQFMRVINTPIRTIKHSSWKMNMEHGCIVELRSSIRRYASVGLCLLNVLLFQ